MNSDFNTLSLKFTQVEMPSGVVTWGKESTDLEVLFMKVIVEAPEIDKI